VCTLACMADRDLINKPLPLVVPEERNPEKKGIPAPVLGKLGVQARAREVGGEADAPKDRGTIGPPAKGGAGRAPGAGAKAPAALPQEVAPKAFRAAYFNQDVQATLAPNLRARPMAALRGEEGATDLKKVTLPAPAHAAPEPEQLGMALARMQAQDLTGLGLAGLLSELNTWTRKEGMTAEMIQARQAQLAQMVAERKEALARMSHLTPGHIQRSRTLTQAYLADGDGLTQDEDLQGAADNLVQRTAEQAWGLHTRLLKVMGTKRR
jgi:hypothetical protein